VIAWRLALAFLPELQSLTKAIGAVIFGFLLLTLPMLAVHAQPWSPWWLSGSNGISVPIIGGPAGMPTIGSGPVNDAQRYQLALAAGFRGEDAIIATAVSIAENGSGKLDALSSTRDLGLWQINELWWARFGGKDALIDPWRNVQAAHTIHGIQGWDAWTTYRNGAYRQFLPRAQQASAAQPVHGPLADEDLSLSRAIAPWMGTRYLLGGNGPAQNVVDCSAFVQLVMRTLGVDLPRTAQQQYNATARVSSPQVGDLIFFHSTYATSEYITHVGFYMSEGVMISAATPAVGRQSLDDPYWRQHFAGYGRTRRTGPSNQA
jgi:cell wall-associated NlpC family hydrolase